MSILFLFLFSSLTADDKDVRFINLNVDQGLSNSEVWSINKDSRGFMWFGTSVGLNRYDGYQFKYFMHSISDTNTISNNHITSIDEDNNGYLWIGTKHGLNRMDLNNESIERYYRDTLNESSLRDNKILKVFCDSKSRVWIINDEGLDMYDTEKDIFIHIKSHEKDNINHYNFISITEDCYGSIWIGGDKIYTLDEEGFIIPVWSDDVSGEGFFLYNTTRNKCWAVNFDNEIYKLDLTDKVFHLYKTTYESNQYLIKCLGEDDNGNLIIGTDGSGVYFVDDFNKEITNLEYDSDNIYGITSNNIISVFSSDDGSFWLGTWRGGVVYSFRQHSNFNHFRHLAYTSNTLVNNNVRVIYEDIEGDIYIGTSEGLSVFDHETNNYKNFELHYAENMTSKFIYCIKDAEPGYLWVGTENGGLLIFDKKNSKFLDQKTSIESDLLKSPKSVLCIQKDIEGNTWFGTYSGIVKYNKILGQYKKYSTSNSKLQTNRILCSYLDKSGCLWFGTNRGICFYNKEKDDFNFIVLYHDYGPFFDQQINAIYEDIYNNFWFTTAGWGLVNYDRETGIYKNYTVKEGLPSDYTCGIIEDCNGHLWISSQKGLFKFNIQNRVVLKKITASEGVQSQQFNPHSYCKMSNGKFYFGGINGITSFIPDQLVANQYIPPVIITDIKLFDIPLNKQKKTNKIDKLNDINETIILKHNENSISFEYVALNFNYPEKNQYSVILEGYNQNFSKPDYSRKTSYNNLEPGTYTFHVIASNNDDIWNREGASVTFKILPPMWLTPLAFTSYAIIASIIIFIVINFLKVRERDKKTILYERMEKENLRKVNNMKLQFFTNVSHDFRTPLSLISAPVEDLIGYQHTDDYQIKKLNTIARNVRRLLNQINDLMTFQKYEHGFIELKSQEIDLVSFVKNTIDYFMPLAKSYKIDLNFFSKHNEIRYIFDQQRFEEIINNILSNAFKYTSAGGSISVQIDIIEKYKDKQHKDSNSEQFVELKFIDNGSGINKGDLPNIFDRFYQGKDEVGKNSISSGLGLAIVKSFVILHEGEVMVDSSPGEGSVFTVLLPLKQSERMKNTVIHERNSINSDYLYNRLLVAEEIPEEDRIFEVIKGKAAPSNSKAIILLVGNDRELINYIEENLRSGYRVYTTFSIDEAWDKINQFIPDLVISDVILGPSHKPDGLDLCKMIKDDSRTGHIPVILLSAKTDLQDRITGLKQGAVAYIDKPFSFTYLSTIIDNIISVRQKLISEYGNYELKFAHNDNPEAETDFLRKVINYIEENISVTDMSVEFLSKGLYISRRHLLRKIKNITGDSPSNLINKIRLNKSIELLKDGKHSVSEVGYLVGFKSPSSFSNTFRKRYGKPPGSFLRKYIL